MVDFIRELLRNFERAKFVKIKFGRQLGGFNIMVQEHNEISDLKIRGWEPMSVITPLSTFLRMV